MKAQIEMLLGEALQFVLCCECSVVSALPMADDIHVAVRN